jgi:hypothetical protein
MGVSENEVKNPSAADRLEIKSVGVDQSHDVGLDAASHRL